MYVTAAGMPRTEAADMAVDPNVIRRVGKDRPRLFISQQFHVGCSIAGVAAEQSVITEIPEVTKP